MKKWLTKQYSQSGSHFFFSGIYKTDKKKHRKMSIRMEGLCFNFLLSQMFYNDYFLLLKQKKNCEGSQSFSYSVETVGGGEEHGQLGIGESRKSS